MEMAENFRKFMSCYHIKNLKYICVVPDEEKKKVLEGKGDSSNAHQFPDQSVLLKGSTPPSVQCSALYLIAVQTSPLQDI